MTKRDEAIEAAARELRALAKGEPRGFTSTVQRLDAIDKAEAALDAALSLPADPPAPVEERERALVRAMTRTNVDPWRPFPVLTEGAPVAGCPQTVPWWWIQQFERRVRENHGQTLAGLSMRGGLSAGEVWCAFHDKPLRDAPTHHVESWLSVAVPTPPASAAEARGRREATAEIVVRLREIEREEDELRRDAAGVPATAVHAYASALVQQIADELSGKGGA